MFNSNYWSSEPLIPQLLVLVLAYAPVLILVFARKSFGRLKTAAWLVTWGAMAMVGEHGGIGMALLAEQAYRLPDHARYHFFMAAIYTFIGAGALVVIAHTLLRAGKRAGWFAVFVAFIVGSIFEVFSGITTFAHGLPPDSIPLGLALYVYIIAWGCALAISFQPGFIRLSRTAPDEIGDT